MDKPDFKTVHKVKIGLLLQKAAADPLHDLLNKKTLQLFLFYGG
jgi:hypothetical protein